MTILAWIAGYLAIGFVVSCFVGRFIGGCNRANERAIRTYVGLMGGGS